MLQKDFFFSKRLHSSQYLRSRETVSSCEGSSSLPCNPQLSKGECHLSPVIHIGGLQMRMEIGSILCYSGYSLLCLLSEHVYIQEWGWGQGRCWGRIFNSDLMLEGKNKKKETRSKAKRKPIKRLLVILENSKTGSQKEVSSGVRK